jgi:hypothetical protein
MHLVMITNHQLSSDVIAGAPASSKNDVKRIHSLTQALAPIVPTMPVLAVGERFMDPSAAPWLSLPVVADKEPVASGTTRVR